MKESMSSSERWLKAELHAHCSWDPVDYKTCEHTPEQLIYGAARLGYDVLAITCHDLDIWNRELSEHAESLGITLIPGMEVTTEGRCHVLVYNFKTGCENLRTLERIREHSGEDTLVVAPHSFFPAKSCLRHLVERNIDVFNALEISGFHTASLDFNRRTRRLAQVYAKPLVGNGDVHMLWQLGKTFSWIYSEPGVKPVLSAIKNGRVLVESTSLSRMQVAAWWTTALWRHIFPVNTRPTKRRLIPDQAY